MDGTTSDQKIEVNAPQIETNSMEAIDAAQDEATIDKIFKSLSEPANQNNEVKGEIEEEAPESQEDNPETKPESLIFGKYSNLDEAEKAFKSMQSDNQKVVERLKDLEKQASTKTLEQLEGMDYDEKMKVLLTKVQEFEEFKAALSEAVENQEVVARKAEDIKAITTFAQKNPILSTSKSLQDIWHLVATHPEMENKLLYGEGGIYDVLFKPAFEKIMGMKIIPKKKPILGGPKTQETTEITNLNDMPLEFFANDENIKKVLGSK